MLPEIQIIASNNLKRLANPSKVHTAVMGFDHLLTNGNIIRLGKQDISYVQLRQTVFIPTMAADYETDYEEYSTDFSEKKIMEYLNNFTPKALKLSPLQVCEYLFRKLKQRFKHRGITVIIGGKLNVLIDKPVEIVKSKLQCCLHKNYEVNFIIS